METWKERLERMAPAAAFLAVSLTVFIVGDLLMPSPVARMARRYLDAAFTCDYMELYSLFDQRVLEGEMARYGLDRAGMEAVARTNSVQAERYVAQLERDYGVKLSYSYQTTDEWDLGPRKLEELQQRYDADGLRMELLAARQAGIQVAVRMKGQDRRKVMGRELELTIIATPQGWSLERDSMYAFLTVLYDLPTFAQENFDG